MKSHKNFYNVGPLVTETGFEIILLDFEQILFLFQDFKYGGTPLHWAKSKEILVLTT